MCRTGFPTKAHTHTHTWKYNIPILPAAINEENLSEEIQLTLNCSPALSRLHFIADTDKESMLKVLTSMQALHFYAEGSLNASQGTLPEDY